MTENPARRFAVSDVLPAVGSRRRAAAWLAVLALAYAGLFAAAAVPARWPTVALMGLVCLAEFAGGRQEPVLPWGLQHLGLPTTGRALLRGLAVVLLAARAGTGVVVVSVTVTVVLLAAAATLLAAGWTVVRYLSRPAVVARRLPLDPGRRPPVPPARLSRVTPAAGLLELALVVVVAWAGSSGSRTTAVVAACAVIAAVPWAGVAVLAVACRRLHAFGLRQRLVDATERAIARWQPELLLYFGGAAEWSYQLDEWLRPLERVRQRTLIVVRDPAVLDRLAGTSLPAIAVPSAPVLMGLAIPSARAALFVGNTAENIHLLRRPGLTSVFVGHGDSDKSASTNPFLRAYREVWVAGDAGRDRILCGDAGIAPENVVAVGRPQQRDVRRHPDRDPRLTVLYAPTWEGFDEDENESSLAVVGPSLVARLLGTAGLRVMYRPHPTAGQRDPAVRRAHREIVRLMRSAGARGVETPAAGTGDGSCWDAVPGHRILVPPRAPTLYETFTRTDALITDVSSVATEFLAADRPYAVVNTSGTSETAFRIRVPSARSAFVLGPDLGELDALLDAARGGADRTARLRAADLEYVLGPRLADPGQAFQEHLDRVCATRSRLST